MNVSTITMPPAKAREKLESYRESLRRRANTEYEAAAQGYAALAAGKALLDMDEVFRTCPYDPKGRPSIAIARADRRRVRFTVQDGNFTTGIFDSSASSLPRTYVGSLVVRVPYHQELASEAARQIRAWDRTGHALVPMTPPDVAGRRVLKDCHVLWEVEQWADRPVSSQPDRDPYLLKHLAGSLYVVEGAWDLTPLERAITNGRKEIG